MDYLILGLAIFSSSVVFISSYFLIKYTQTRAQIEKDYLDTYIPIHVKASCDFPLELTTVENGIITIHKPVIYDFQSDCYNTYHFQLDARPGTILSFEIYHTDIHPKYGFKAEILTPEKRIITSDVNSDYDTCWVIVTSQKHTPIWVWDSTKVAEGGLNNKKIILYEVRI
jgi:hypothetical protein